MTRRERCLGLAAWEARLARPGFDAGHWVKSAPDADGVLHLGWFEYSAGADAFRADCARYGWVVPHEWMAWAGTPDGVRLLGDPAAIASASVEDLEHIVTTMVRGDRFSEGSFGAAIERGFALAIARRAGELAQGLPERD
jgi:hypothetical protein